MSPKTTASRPKKPNFNIIHKNPLPVTVQPLPLFVPHNPLSLLYTLYSYIFRLYQPEPLYQAQFDTKSRTIHVTDQRSALTLWNNGFFGKGSLSRSEPTWLLRRRKALGMAGTYEVPTAEEFTEDRRRERRVFKLERARVAKERVQDQLFQEGKITSLDISDTGSARSVHFATPQVKQVLESPPSSTGLENLEHLQLTFEETFFLVYGLGALKLSQSESKKAISTRDMFTLFQHYSSIGDTIELSAGNRFVLNYVVYHHFRSLGWVVRSGVKFAVDYLLYNRGPVFSHAEYGILIIPSYSNPEWSQHDEQRIGVMKQWSWLHCANRVSTQVKKTIILVYVDIPPAQQLTDDMNIAKLLSKYRIREFSLRRWLVSKNRD